MFTIHIINSSTGILFTAVLCTCFGVPGGDKVSNRIYVHEYNSVFVLIFNQISRRNALNFEKIEFLIFLQR